MIEFTRSDVVRKSLPLLLQFWAIWLACSSAALGQQTIVNVPSDALTPTGQVFLMHETQLSWGSKTPDYNTTNFFAYGLNEQTELAITLYNVDEFGSDAMALGVGFKSVRELHAEWFADLEPKWTYGFLAPISLAEQDTAVGYFGFTHLTFAVPQTELRLLGGVAAGSRNLFDEDAVSALVGVEYPISEHLAFTGEWFSGPHNLSGLIPGLTYHKERLILVAGLKIPNSFDPDKYGFVLECGWFFGPSHKSDVESAVEFPHYGTR